MLGFTEPMPKRIWMPVPVAFVSQAACQWPFQEDWRERWWWGISMWSLDITIQDTVTQCQCSNSAVSISQYIAASDSRGNVSGEELRMGLHDLGFKLSDADLSSIMAVIATQLNPSRQWDAVVRMKWFAFSEFLWTFRDPTKTNTVNTLILYTSRVKVVQVSNFSTRTTLPHACCVHICHQGQRRRRRGQRQGVRSGHAGGGEAAIEERETGSLEARYRDSS